MTRLATWEHPAEYGPVEYADCPVCGEPFDREQDGVTSNESADVLLCRSCADAELVETALMPSASLTSADGYGPSAR